MPPARHPIAVSTWLWHAPLTDSVLESRIRLLSEWGFDAVEMPLEAVHDWDCRRRSRFLPKRRLKTRPPRPDWVGDLLGRLGSFYLCQVAGVGVCSALRVR